MIVSCIFDDGDFGYKFDAMPVVGNILLLDKGRYVITEVGFIENGSEMLPFATCESDDPTEAS